MLTKLLIFGIVIFCIYFFFFKTKRTEEVSKKETKKKSIDGETMVECKVCSTFISDKESIIKDGAFYCSKECARIET
ncbi:MAG: PP0621 family protein [Sulfurospirillaceae bacterium]|nr:PP0621 family protein [Sulfurospirillaceae bacterium]